MFFFTFHDSARSAQLKGGVGQGGGPVGVVLAEAEWGRFGERGKASRVGRRVGWYGQVLENFMQPERVYGRVKNALRLGQNRVGREKWGCREKLKGGGG